MTNRMLAGMIVVATALFVIGVSLEKSETHDHDAEPATHVEVEGSEEGAEAEEIREASDAESGGREEGEEEGEEEGLLGIDLESTPLIMLAAIISLGLAATAWTQPENVVVLLVVGLSMLAFTVLDVREVAHQLDESENGIVLLAALVALLHGVAAVLAIGLSRSRRRPRPLSP